MCNRLETGKQLVDEEDPSTKTYSFYQVMGKEQLQV
jgi:hypothetical protein